MQPREFDGTGSPGPRDARAGAREGVLPLRPRPAPWRVLLLITSSDFGGTESFLCQLSTRLDRGRFSPLVCSLCPPGRVAGRIAASGTAVETLGMSPQAHPLALLAGIWRLARRIDRWGIDLVHGLLYRANVMAALAGRLARRRPVVVAGQRSLAAMTGRPAEISLRWARRLCDHTVAVSEAVHRELVRSEGLDPARVLVIPNGVDTDRFRPGDRQAAKQRLGLPQASTVIGAVGRMAPNKGLDLLVDAAALLRRRACPVELALVGDGTERRRLEERAARLGLEPHVHFAGVREDIESLYPAFDAFALPSLEEGSPMALLEAMACGCPVVATRVGGVPEVVEEGRSGLLVRPGSAEELAAALGRLTVDVGLRQDLAIGARRRVVGRFDLATMVRRHEELYRSLLSSKLPTG